MIARLGADCAENLSREKICQQTQQVGEHVAGGDRRPGARPERVQAWRQVTLYVADLVPWNRDDSHNSRAGHPVWLRCSSLTYAQ